jgi:RimJ/RimL family protein N-acetyltransferase
MVPVLETERLVLRGHRLEDFPIYAAMWSDPVFLRHVGPARTEEESWTRFVFRNGLWSLMGYGLWAVEVKEGGIYIGDAGFMRTRRGLPIDCGDLPEGGWTLVPSAHGKGYGREATMAAVAWADRYLDAPRTWCLINAENAMSLKIAARLGYREAAHVTLRDAPALVLTRDRP